MLRLFCAVVATLSLLRLGLPTFAVLCCTGTECGGCRAAAGESGEGVILSLQVLYRQALYQ